MFDNVVVGATESEASIQAVRRAIEVTKAAGGTLHIVTAFKAKRPNPPEMPEEFRYSYGSIDPVDVLLNRLKLTASQASIRVTTNPVLSDPVEAIIRVANQENADLIVVGSKRPNGHWHTSHVPEALVGRAPCAVLVV